MDLLYLGKLISAVFYDRKQMSDGYIEVDNCLHCTPNDLPIRVCLSTDIRTKQISLHKQFGHYMIVYRNCSPNNVQLGFNIIDTTCLELHKQH